MRGGVYDEILPEPEGNPEGGAQGISRGFRQYFILYPDSSHNTVILNPLIANIFLIAIFSRIGSAMAALKVH